MKKNKFYYWSCDCSKNSGEGQLALLFLKKYSKNYQFKNIKFKNSSISTIKKLINYKYLIPFVGILYCWKYYFNNKNIAYINYLPFWNFLIFLLLPPKTLIGPITGGARFKKTNNFYLVRKYFFPLFYKISEIIVNYRNYNLVFSTNLLKKHLGKKMIKKSVFNFVIKNFNFKKKKTKKSIDFLIYYRIHENKTSTFPYYLINNLIISGFKINIVGDKIKNKKIINHGFINHTKLSKLQAKTRYTISSSENLYSFFTLECLKNNVKILINSSDKVNIPFFKKNFLRINFKNIQNFNKVGINKI